MMSFHKNNSIFPTFAPMNKIIRLILLMLFISNFASAQSFKIHKGDTINRTDAKGLKQGVWKRFYDNDQLFSETTFKNGKPVSNTTTFYKSGEKQSVMTYDKAGTTARMISYWPNGKIKAVGKYVNQEKDSTWNYYNEVDTLIVIENYKLGKPEGVWKTYTPAGVLLEETTYSKGLKNGPHKLFFQWQSKNGLHLS